MERIQRILVATDFSVRADRAVRRAAKLAAGHEAELYLPCPTLVAALSFQTPDGGHSAGNGTAAVRSG
jgi:nucleotide-binding universal stress UspA family protein